MSKNKFEILNLNPFFSNSIIIYNDSNAVIFDAWGSIEEWDIILKQRDLKLKAIYSTHGHFDHISCAPFLAEKYNINWYLNYKDLSLLQFNNLYLKEFNLPLLINYKEPLNLLEGNIDIFGENVFVYETPGHSEGSVVFYFKTTDILISGDTLFKDTIGRYDLPNSDFEKLKTSLNKIKKINFSDNTILISGHGDITDIKTVKKINPWFK